MIVDESFLKTIVRWISILITYPKNPKIFADSQKTESYKIFDFSIEES